MWNKKKWYIFYILFFLWVVVIIGKVLERYETKNNSDTKLSVIVLKDSEQKYADLMSGIRDCARENSILLNTIYAEDMDAKELSDALVEEKQLGSDGVLIIHPEDFYLGGDALKSDVAVAVLVISNEPMEGFSEFAFCRYQDNISNKISLHLQKSDIQRLLAGEINELVVVNEYRMGYSCIDSLAKRRGDISDISVENLVLTAEDINAGKYNSILSGR